MPRLYATSEPAAGAARGPTGTPLSFAQRIKSSNDQEVAGEAQLLTMVSIQNQADLDIPAFGQTLGFIWVSSVMRFCRPSLDWFAQIIVQALSVGVGKSGKRGLPNGRVVLQRRAISTLFCAMLRVNRQITPHLCLRLEILLRGKCLYASLVVEHITFGDAHPHFVRLEIGSFKKLHRVGGNHWQV